MGLIYYEDACLKISENKLSSILWRFFGVVVVATSGFFSAGWH